MSMEQEILTTEEFSLLRSWAFISKVLLFSSNDGEKFSYYPQFIFRISF